MYNVQRVVSAGLAVIFYWWKPVHTNVLIIKGACKLIKLFFRKNRSAIVRNLGINPFSAIRLISWQAVVLLMLCGGVKRFDLIVNSGHCSVVCVYMKCAYSVCTCNVSDSVDNGCLTFRPIIELTAVSGCVFIVRKLSYYVKALRCTNTVTMSPTLMTRLVEGRSVTL